MPLPIGGLRMVRSWLIQREYRRLLKCNALKERKGQMHLLLGQLEASSEQRRTIGRD